MENKKEKKSFSEFVKLFKTGVGFTAKATIIASTIGFGVICACEGVRDIYKLLRDDD